MPKDDHLDKETSISAEVTKAGVKAGAKSRLVAAIDRLGGAVVDLVVAHIEAPAERKRARTAGEVKLIETIAQYGVEQLGANPDEAERAFQRHFRKVLKEQENADGVMRAALEDLHENPPNEASSNDETPISEEFLDRLEGYSATASSEDLRKRWGRVLAAEVRKPGTFSGKVMRVVDELDSETALIFEQIAKHRIGTILPKTMTGELSFDEQSSLVLSGLLVEPGLGQIVSFRPYSTEGFWSFGNVEVGLVTFPLAVKVTRERDETEPVFISADGPAFSCYVLTPEAKAICSIIEDRQFEALSEYAAKLNNSLNVPGVRLWLGDGKQYLPYSELTPGR